MWLSGTIWKLYIYWRIYFEGIHKKVSFLLQIKFSCNLFQSYNYSGLYLFPITELVTQLSKLLLQKFKSTWIFSLTISLMAWSHFVTKTLILASISVRRCRANVARSKKLLKQQFYALLTKIKLELQNMYRKFESVFVTFSAKYNFQIFQSNQFTHRTLFNSFLCYSAP